MASRRQPRTAIIRHVLLGVLALMLLISSAVALAAWLLFEDLARALELSGAFTRAELTSLLQQRLWIIWPLVVGLLLAVLASTWWVARRLALGLDLLRIGMLRVGRGEFGAQLPRLKGELRGVVTTFNAMSAELLRTSTELQQRNQSLAAQVESLEARLRVVQALASTLDRDQLLAQLATMLHGIYGFERVCIALPERESLLVYDGAAAADGVLPAPHRVALNTRTAAGLAALRGEPQLFPDIVPAGLLPPPTNADARAELAVPVLHEGTALAVIDVQTALPNSLGGAELSQLQMLAEQFVPALTNSGVYRTELLRRQLAEAIYLVTQRLSATHPPAELPTLLLDQLVRVIPHDRSLLLAAEGRYASVLAAYGWLDLPVRLDPQANALLGQLLREGQPILLGDAVEDARYSPLNGAPPARAWLGAPLLRQGRAVGALIVESDTPGHYGVEEQRALTALAGQAAVALENSQLYAETAERARYLKVVNEMILAITTLQDWHGLLNTIIQQIRRLVPCDHASIALYDAASDTFSIEATYDARGNDLLAGMRFPADDSPWQLAYNAGQPVYQSDLCRSAFRRDQDLAASGLRSGVVIPIQGDVGKLGTLNLACRAPSAFRQDQIRLLVELAPYLASALNNLRLREARSELSSARERLSEGEQVKLEATKLRTISQLASGVAHDVNNTLAGILGNAQLLLLDEREDERRAMLKIIEQAARDGAETVRRLQTYARQDQQITLTDTRLDLLCGDALDLTRPRWRDTAQSRGATIQVERDLRQVPPIAGNPSELREVLTNLIINAVDAMPKGGTLRVSTAEAPATGALAASGAESLVVVTVADTGMGMAPEVRARIFEPFFTTKGQQGTGLGLPVSKGIVEHHGGQIEVESQPGRGTSFTIRLPVLASVANAEVTDDEPELLAPTRILVIEDQLVVREALARLLRSWGHTVEEAADGAQGLERFAQQPYDFVISDLGLPQASGFAVLGQIKARNRHVVTLLLTGWGNEIDLEEAKARGADALLAKPFGRDELRKAMASALASARPPLKVFS
jgi:signal transduction histidine kinase/ActR/RegA family two-component response regulator/putative methionine-R-sulfoxide reductase with GAF domain